MKSLDSTWWRSTAWYLILFFVLLLPPQVQAQGPVVQILLFYSDTCPHCHEVMENVLPPLQAKYGPRLQVRALEISDAKNFELLLQLEAAYQVPEERVGIPEIFIGSEYLIGSILIGEKLDGLIEAYLAQGGVNYPTVEGASTPPVALADATPTPAPAANATAEAAAPATPAPVVSFYVFWDSKCGPCLKLMNEVLPDILSRYPKEQVSVDARNLEHGSYTLMRDLETQFGLELGTMPEIFIGNEVLLGLDAIQNRLPSLLDQYLAAGGIGLPQLGDPPAPSALLVSPSDPETEQVKPIYLAYFYQVGCRECDRAELDLKYLQQKYPQLQVGMYDSRENAALLEELGVRAGVLESRRLLAPAVFVGNDALILEEVSASRLEALIGDYLVTGAPAAWTENAVPESQAVSGIVERFRSFGVLTVAVAGLIDGLNPCAFATVVFFISYLAFVGRRGKEVLVVGLAFTLGVFLTYLGVGFGFLKAVAALPILAQLGPWLYGLTAALCFVLAAFSLHDFWKARRGKPEDMRLKLPTTLRKRINRVIREGAGLKAFIPVAFGTGVVISLIELACTGQIYLPVIMFVLSVPEMQAQAVSYLFLYNLMFIIPLVIVFLAAYWGTSSERMGMFVNRHTSIVKLATSILFVVMGIWLVFTLVG